MNIRSICLCIALLSALDVAVAQTGFVGKAQPKTAPSAGAGTVVAGLPNIKGTTLGFMLDGGTPWGSSKTIENPALIKQSKAGPNQDLCVIGTALYRTFNQGDYAVGSFIDILYLNGTPVHFRNVASLAPGTSVDFENKDLSFREGMNVLQVKMDANNNIAESDENNTFEIKLTVKHDCNGDGIVAGMPGQLKNAAPAPKTQGVKDMAQPKAR